MHDYRDMPWVSGPGEILRHGLELLATDTDTNRRLAMISIDNAVELMIKTYLGLPKKVTGLAISRKELDEVSFSFPKLLQSLEKNAPDKLDGVNLATVEWYHRLRNQLYHDGNGLTVEREKAEVYAALASVLFWNLFGLAMTPQPLPKTANLDTFMVAWAELEKSLRSLGSRGSFVQEGVELGRLIEILANTAMITKEEHTQIKRLREIRNSIVHGISDHKGDITVELIDAVRNRAKVFQARWASGPSA